MNETGINTFSNGAGGSQYGQNNGEFKVSTSLISMFDESSVQLRLGALEEAMSIAIWIPAIDQATGKRTYPQEMRHNTLLTIERLTALNILIQQDILPAYERGENIYRGIFTSNKNINQVGVGVNDGKFYLYLHLNISQERVPADTFVYEFSKMPYLSKYDYKTGEFEMATIDAQFFLFSSCVKMLQEVGATSISGHSVRYSNRRTVDKVFKYLEGIAKELKVSVEAPAYARTPRGGNFLANSGAQPTLPASEMQEAASISDLL